MLKHTQKILDEIESQNRGIELKELHLNKCSILEKETQYEMYEDLRAEFNFDEEVLDHLDRSRCDY